MVPSLQTCTRTGVVGLCSWMMSQGLFQAPGEHVTKSEAGTSKIYEYACTWHLALNTRKRCHLRLTCRASLAKLDLGATILSVRKLTNISAIPPVTTPTACADNPKQIHTCRTKQCENNGPANRRDTGRSENQCTGKRYLLVCETNGDRLRDEGAMERGGYLAGSYLRCYIVFAL